MELVKSVCRFYAMKLLPIVSFKPMLYLAFTVFSLGCFFFNFSSLNQLLMIADDLPTPHEPHDLIAYNHPKAPESSSVNHSHHHNHHNLKKTDKNGDPQYSSAPKSYGEDESKSQQPPEQEKATVKGVKPYNFERYSAEIMNKIKYIRDQSDDDNDDDDDNDNHDDDDDNHDHGANRDLNHDKVKSTDDNDDNDHDHDHGANRDLNHDQLKSNYEFNDNDNGDNGHDHDHGANRDLNHDQFKSNYEFNDKDNEDHGHNHGADRDHNHDQLNSNDDNDDNNNDDNGDDDDDDDDTASAAAAAAAGVVINSSNDDESRLIMKDQNISSVMVTSTDSRSNDSAVMNYNHITTTNQHDDHDDDDDNGGDDHHTDDNQNDDHHADDNQNDYHSDHHTDENQNDDHSDHHADENQNDDHSDHHADENQNDNQSNYNVDDDDKIVVMTDSLHSDGHVPSPKQQEEEEMHTANNLCSSTKNPMGSCDLTKGRWVRDETPPPYSTESCSFIHGNQDCVKNGRPDTEYLFWRWQPSDCSLPRFDATVFLQHMRNKKMLFVGDSLARNHMESLFCTLTQVDHVDVGAWWEHMELVNFTFPSYNFTLGGVWAPFLVKHEPEAPGSPNMKLHIDQLHELWVSTMNNYDVVVFSGAYWLYRPSIYCMNNQNVSLVDPDDPGYPQTLTAMKLVWKNVFDHVLSSYNGTVVLRTLSISHFESSSWDHGGSCNKTQPNLMYVDGNNMVLEWQHNEVYRLQRDAFAKAVAENEKREHGHLRLRLLDVTSNTLLRPDAHPGIYRVQKSSETRYDCLHWCLPGPMDTWNQLLLADPQIMCS